MTSVSHPGRRATGGLLAAVALAACLTGCVSTQQKATWLHVTDARVITAQSPTLVRTGNPQVRTQAVALIRRGAHVVVAVRLRNLSRRTFVDLPISVGIRSRTQHTVYLNRSGDLGYFQSHVATIPADATVDWVLVSRLRNVPSGRPFALVGPRPVPAMTVGHTAPHIRTRLVSQTGDRLRIRVSNRSAVPQPQLQLYAIVPASGRVTAAGSLTLPQLGSGQTVVTDLTLLGRPAGGARLEVLPTMFLP